MTNLSFIKSSVNLSHFSYSIKHKGCNIMLAAKIAPSAHNEYTFSAL
ncbi:hypothetical protein [Wolbachia endosymbiont (group A) of Gymnosoma rotundatum]|nr:hypothetical protein [Wolbachia endosymbiont (group A) of Gymnosoma rotundatum]